MWVPLGVGHSYAVKRSSGTSQQTLKLPSQKMQMIRLNKRLDALESANSSVAVSLDADRLLVSLLGRLDALFWPFRSHTGSYRAVVRARQLDYISGKCGLSAKSQGQENWKVQHYTRAELTTAGLCTAITSGGQVTALRLTPAGLCDATSMVGDRLATLANHPTMVLLELIRRFEGCEHSGKWLLENNLFGSEVCVGDNPNAWEFAIDFLQPLLRCGVIESTSDLYHRVYFRLVDGVVILEEPVSTRQIEPWADALYIASYNAERESLQRLQCDDGGIYIPMRAT